MSELTRIIDSVFGTKAVVVIGDLVADQYLNGTIARVSREAPVFILRHDETTTLPGAAANAAANIASLGGLPVLIGVRGTDADGEFLSEAIERCGVDTADIVAATALRTTTKLRVLAGQSHAVRQQVIRIDYENQSDFPSDVRRQLLDKVAVACERADAIIVSDYNYGVADAETFELAKTIASRRNIPLVVDSRFRLRDFSGATAATPNQDEVEQILGKGFSSEQVATLCSELGYEALLVTNGNKGMQLFEKGGSSSQIDAVGSLEPVDVTGAGDTVIAAFALGLASGLSFADAARVANHAGGLVVMKKGTATVTAAELIGSLERESKSLASRTNV